MAATDAFGNPTIAPSSSNQPIPIGRGTELPSRVISGTQQIPLYTGDTVEYGTIPTRTVQEFNWNYFEGNEWTYFATSSSDYIRQVQTQLADAGLLTKYTPGEWDPNSANAMSIIMEMANYSGMTWDQTLARILATGGFQKTAAPSGGGLAAPTMTDEDIRTVANKTAQGVLGRNLREDEVSSFIPAFRSMFAGGTSAATAGEMVVREQIAPEEAGAYGIGNVMQAIGTALGGAG